MKKNIFIFSIITALVLTFTGCEKSVTTEDTSILTHYVAIFLNGGVDNGTLLTVPAGEEFEDPGFIALEKGDTVTSKVEVEGEVDGTQEGYYEITYSAVNKDGFTSSITRKVIIYDPAAPSTDLTAIYKAKIPRTRGTTVTSKSPSSDITIKKLAPGFFEVSDFIGAWYTSIAGYPPSTCLTGYMKINADNSLTLISSISPYWGDSLDDLENGTYNPTTKEVKWDAWYAGMKFAVTLTFDRELED